MDIDIDELIKAGLTGWPLAIVSIAIVIGFVSIWRGWPWEGIIVHKHYHKDYEDEEDEE